MKKIVLVVCLALFGATAVSAEEVKVAGLKPDDVKNALGVSFYLQGGYTYNGNASQMTTGSGENDLRVLDHTANSFTLDLAQIVILKDPSAPGAAGFKVKISAGEWAKLIHAYGLGDAAPGQNPEAFDLTEAYISYIAGVGKGLRFDFGKMGTFIGGEVLEAKDNPNYSRSYLFTYAEPLTHTGLKMGYAFTDAVNAAFFVVNGWDNATDNNKAKSYGLSLGLTPSEVFSASINLLQGAEQTDNSSNMRTLWDIVATIKPTKKLAVSLNYDDGKEEQVPGTSLPSGVTGDAKWNGLSGIVKYDLTDKYAVALRGEYFDDKDGYRTGTVQKLKEVTLTFDAKLDGGLILRPEYRHDSSDKQSFDNDTKKTQDTIALAVMYSW
jgi:Putative beta-barrel porin-2, OmpL-like. bbp2